MNAALPITCSTCGERMLSTDERCPYGHVNPTRIGQPPLASDAPTIAFPPRPKVVTMPAPAREAGAAGAAARDAGPAPGAGRDAGGGTAFGGGFGSAAPAAGASFDSILRGLAVELASARASGCKVIVNVGQSGAGKSWLIARMGASRPGTRRATLYSEKRPPEEQVIQTGERLARTLADEIYVWHLEPKDPGTGRATRSGSWRIIDIAGELVSNPQFVNSITSGRPLYDLLTMTLAHASAVVLVIDGEDLSREDRAGARGHSAPVDEQNAGMLNELVRLLAFLQHHTPGAPPLDLEQLEGLKAKIRDNPRLDLGAAGHMLSVPVLLLVSKADAVAGLAPGSDPLRYGSSRLPLTHAKALQTVRVARWAAAAPFVGQSSVADIAEGAGFAAGAASAREQLDFQRPSYGVGQALDWLDEELMERRMDTGLTTRRALSPVLRWVPWARARRASR
jgi:hypothetical protein